MSGKIRDAFCQNAPPTHLVDHAPGFLGMEVMSPLGNANEVWLLALWSDEESHCTLARSRDCHESPKGIPKGLSWYRGAPEYACSKSSWLSAADANHTK